MAVYDVHGNPERIIPMTKGTSNLIPFLEATIVAPWVTYFIIVFNSWNPYTMPGLGFLLVGGSAPSWVDILFVLFTCDRVQRRDYFRRCFSFQLEKTGLINNGAV